MGFILGDGALNFRRENIAEAYYTAHLGRGVYLSPALQTVANPGYNHDRGPLMVGSLRTHVEF
jgi:carbohydrate-selective porin OprB